MLINIIVPNKNLYKDILKKTKNFYSDNFSLHSQLDTSEQYCITIKKSKIQIIIKSFNRNTKAELNKYIDYVFKGDYIGVSGDYGFIDTKKVTVFKI